MSNTATAITTNDYMTVDSSATYAIVGIPARGNGNALVCPWSASSKAARRSVVSPRGGGSNAVGQPGDQHHDVAVGPPLSRRTRRHGDLGIVCLYLAATTCSQPNREAAI